MKTYKAYASLSTGVVRYLCMTQLFTYLVTDNWWAPGLHFAKRSTCDIFGWGTLKIKLTSHNLALRDCGSCYRALHNCGVCIVLRARGLCIT